MSLLQTVPGGNSFDLSALLQNSVAFLGNSVSAILQRAVSTIGSVASFAMDLFVAIVFAVYCLFQKERKTGFRSIENRDCRI